MIRSTLILLAAGSAASQPDMLITVDNVENDRWEISAKFLTQPPSAIVQVWADTSFRLFGDGSDFTITDWNPSYDTSLLRSPPVVINGPVAEFVGNANDFFGTTDPSNPLWAVDFEYEGDPTALRLELEGQNSAIFEQPPFGDVRLYQDFSGNPGSLTWDVVIIPSPGTLALAPLALVAAQRRRK
ncbi:MAG: hypothetical protein AAGJ54_04860 [Planctomycetota bacterium]